MGFCLYVTSIAQRQLYSYHMAHSIDVTGQLLKLITITLNDRLGRRLSSHMGVRGLVSLYPVGDRMTSSCGITVIYMELQQIGWKICR